MNIFFITVKNHKEASLDKDESRHCMKVLRHRVGDTVEGVDGEGNHYRAAISDWDKKTVSLRIAEIQPEWGEKAPFIRLAISPLRTKDRFEWCAEKATELGVNEIVPLICHRSVKAKIKETRLAGILRSALKQSKRSRLPNLLPPTPFGDLVPSINDGLGLIPYMEGSQTLHDLRPQIENADRITVLVGPEGGFTNEEVHLAQTHGYSPVSLGTNRLRAETAALHCLSAIKMLQEW